MKNPLKRRTSGARMNRTVSWEMVCHQPGLASTGLDCETGFTTQRPLESLPSAQRKHYLLEQRGRSYRREGGPSGRNSSRWPDNYNGQSPRTRRNETSHR